MTQVFRDAGSVESSRCAWVLPGFSGGLEQLAVGHAGVSLHVAVSGPVLNAVPAEGVAHAAVSVPVAVSAHAAAAARAVAFVPVVRVVAADVQRAVVFVVPYVADVVVEHL